LNLARYPYGRCIPSLKEIAMQYVKGEIKPAVPEYEVCRVWFEDIEGDDLRSWVATFRVYARSSKLKGAVTLVLKSVVDTMDGEIRNLTQREEAEVVGMALRKVEDEAEFRAW
jgi:hypothetical protein